MTAQNAYISIKKIEQQKTYPKDIDGVLQQPVHKTFAVLGGAVNAESWVNGDRFAMNHRLVLDGELTRAEIYTQLKTMQIPQFELDLTTATDA